MAVLNFNPSGGWLGGYLTDIFSQEQKGINSLGISMAEQAMAQEARDRAAEINKRRFGRRQPREDIPQMSAGSPTQLYGFEAPPMTLNGTTMQMPQVNAAPPLPPPVEIASPQVASPNIPMPQSRPANIDMSARSQPEQQMVPTPQAPQQGGFGNWLSGNSNMLIGLGAGIASGGDWGEGISRGLIGAQKGMGVDRQQVNQLATQNAMMQALVQRGYSPVQAATIARAAATDPKLAAELLPQALGLRPPNTIEGVIASNLYKNQGSPQQALGALSAVKQAEAEGSSAGKVVGERTATAQIDLPTAVSQAQEQLRLIDQLRKHPGRSGVGWHGYASSYIPDSALPGNTQSFDANEILKQLKSTTFLEAYKSLRGGGQISNAEGAKAESAIARLNRAQSKQAFDEALSDYEGILRLGIDRANQQAGQKAPYGFQGNQPIDSGVKPKSGTYDWTPSSGLRQRGG